MASGPITSWQIEGEKVEAVTDFILLGSKITTGGDCSHEIKTLGPWKESYDKPRQCITKQRHHLADKSLYSQSYSFSSSHIQIWELIHKEDWAWKNRCFQIVVLRRLLRVTWTARSNQSILKEKPWIIIGRMVAETPKLWPPDENSQLASKALILGKIEGARIRGQQTMR